MVNSRSFLGAVLLVLATGLGFQPSANAEQLGQSFVSDMLLQPSFRLGEETTSGFELESSYFGISWQKDQKFRARFLVGDKRLMGTQSITQFTFGLIEASASYVTPYGDVSAGLIPIAFGLQAGASEAELVFPRSLIFENFFMSLRDMGASYSISHNGFYTTATIHHGDLGTEPGDQSDDRFFHTAVFGWRGPAGLHTGLSGQTGWYRSGAQGVKRRVANLYGGFRMGNLSLGTEAIYGEDIAGSITSKFTSWHVDLEHPLTDSTSLLARFDDLDENSDVGGDITQRSTLGWALKSEDESSVLFVYASNLFKESRGESDWEGLILWRLTSFFKD